MNWNEHRSLGMLEYLTLIVMVTSKNFLSFPCVKYFLKHLTFSQIFYQKIKKNKNNKTQATKNPPMLFPPENTHDPPLLKITRFK